MRLPHPDKSGLAMTERNSVISVNNLIYAFNYHIRGEKMVVREATKEYLEKIKMETLKKALIEQCKDTAKLNLEICDDFKYVDGEQE
jgi:hypothetical protein